MPWKGKQAQAIFLQKKREGGEQHARDFMHKHGHRSGNRKREAMIRKFQRKHGGGHG